MSDFSDTVRKAFESYLRGEKEEAFDQLIPGSFYHHYLKIVDACKPETNTSKDKLRLLVQDMKRNLARHSDSLEITKLELQSLLT